MGRPEEDAKAERHDRRMGGNLEETCEGSGIGERREVRLSHHLVSNRPIWLVETGFLDLHELLGSKIRRHLRRSINSSSFLGAGSGMPHRVAALENRLD
jgi:hypothetical protein